MECIGNCGSSGSGGNNTSGCDRDLAQYEDSKEELVKWKFDSKTDMQKACGKLGWLLEGEVEMRAIEIIHINGVNDGGKTVEGHFNHARSEYACSGGSCPWLIENYKTFDFDKDENGDRYKIKWVEVDDKTFQTTVTVSYGVEVPTQGGTVSAKTEVEIKISVFDDEVGSNFVEYCDNADVYGYDYTTGAVDWNTRVEQ